VLGIVPTAEMWRRVDKEFGIVDWHWFFLAQPLWERLGLISAAPDTHYFRGDRLRFHPKALGDYHASVRNRPLSGQCAATTGREPPSITSSTRAT
jgi:haloacetate dehalogenase